MPMAAADAHGLDAELLVVPLQRVDQRAGDAGAGHAERVADRDRAAVDVELVQRRCRAACAEPERLDRERLVDLEQVDVVDAHARRCARACRDRLDRAEAHDLGGEGGDRRWTRSGPAA